MNDDVIALGVIALNQLLQSAARLSLKIADKSLTLQDLQQFQADDDAQRVLQVAEIDRAIAEGR